METNQTPDYHQRSIGAHNFKGGEKSLDAQQRVSDSTARPFLFQITNKGRQFLLHEGTDQRYGARHPKRAIERNVVSPLAKLLATARPGDVLIIDRHPGEKRLVFLRETKHQTLYAQMPFVASFSRNLTAGEVTA